MTMLPADPARRAHRWVGALAEEVAWLAQRGGVRVSVGLTAQGTASSARLGLSPGEIAAVLALLRQAAGPDEPTSYADIDVITSVHRGTEEPARATDVSDLLPTRPVTDPAWLSGAEANAETLYRAALRLLVADIGTALRSAGAYLLWAAAVLGHERARDRLIEERARWRQRDDN
jgi:hypothetical protein